MSINNCYTMVQNNQLDHNLKDARRKNSDNNIRFCPVESVTKLQQLFCQNIIFRKFVSRGKSSRRLDLCVHF